MKYLSLIITLFVLFTFQNVNAQQPDFTGIKVCLDPGHSGHESDDRGMPNGFWESEGNLTKGLWLRDLLEERGCEVFMTRTTNTGIDSIDDWPLSQRAQLAIDNEVDLFVSIHSNAATGYANFPLTIYNGYTNNPNVPLSQVYAEILWEHFITNNLTDWTNTDPHAVGDLTLNPSWTYGYGVLYPLSAPGIVGIISEGSMHDFEPEVWRLLNLEWRKQESWRLLYAMEEYFELGTESLGQIAGWVRDSLREKLDYSRETFDKYEPVDTATVYLVETDETYFVDTSKNGYFYFDSLAPGNYTLIISATDYYTDTVEVEVVANDFTQVHQWQEIDKSVAPYIMNFSIQDQDTIQCYDPISIQFSIYMDTASVRNGITFSPEIDVQYEWDTRNQNVTIQPLIPYDTSTLYTMTFTEEITHQWGVELVSDTSIAFFTGDKNRYTIESTYPSVNQTDLSALLQFRIIFDAPLNNSSLIGSVFIESEDGDLVGTRSAQITVVDGKGHYYFMPYEELEYETDYDLVLSGSISDNNNIPMVNTVRIPFRTQQSIPHYALINEMENIEMWFMDYENSIGLNSSSLLYTWADEKVSGEASLMVRYVFDGSNGECHVKPNIDIHFFNPDETAGLWVWGDLSQHELYMVLSDNSLQLLAELDFAGWRYCTIPVNAGNNQLEGFRLIQNGGETPVGYIFLDALGQYAPVNAENALHENTVTVFPNPINGNDIWISNLESNASSYSIYDLTGKILQEGFILGNAGKVSLDKEVLNSNLLFISIHQNGSDYTEVLINNK